MPAVKYPYTIQTSEPELQYEEFNGAKFGYMLWPSNTDETKGRIILVHGFGEYTRIQYRLMDYLSMNGYESFTFDQRGAGVTSPNKLKGKTNESHTFKDLEHFIEKNLKETQDLGIPLFLWGHSMGGGIILNYACQGDHKDDISGYIGSGPLIILHPHSQPNKITRMISPLLGNLLGNTVIDTGLDLEGITSDPNYRNFLGNDPMSVPLKGSFRQIYDFLQRGQKLYDDKDQYIEKQFAKGKPVIIFHGKEDTINDPRGSIKFIEKCPSNDKTLRLLPGMRHSIFSLETEANVNLSCKEMVEWLNTHLN